MHFLTSLIVSSSINQKLSLVSGGSTRARSVEWWVTPASETTTPLAHYESSVIKQVSTAVSTTTPAGTSLSTAQPRSTVVVVDDNADMLGYVSRVLSDGGFEVCVNLFFLLLCTQLA